MVLLWCRRGVAMVLLWCRHGVAMVFQWCCSGIADLKESYKKVLKQCHLRERE
jgi:hypothetical protein